MNRIDDKTVIGAHLRRNVALHIYELGDLDPFFWPHTRFYSSGDAMCMVYEHPAEATLLALCEAAEVDAMQALLAELAPHLPDELYTHLSPGVALPGYAVQAPREHLRMLLTEPQLPSVSGVDPIGVEHQDEVIAFYAACYPGNWFDKRMLETGCYFAAREAGRLVSVAGIHVFSPEQRVAALGNIATDPAMRRRGYGRRTTVACVRHLLDHVDVIGLNVKADNVGAIAMYRDLGFAPIAGYSEGLARRRA